jgi:pimeloyl-ACP methyl ester carboxylesterase
VTFIAGADCQTTTLAAARRFADFTHPVTVVWGNGDKVFPLSDGERLAKAFPNASLVRVEGPMTFVPLDAPTALAEALDGLVQQAGQDES